MKKFKRKHSLDKFALQLIGDCWHDSNKDVVLHCADGRVLLSRFFLGVVSPMLMRILNDCVYNALSEVTILLPDFYMRDIEKLSDIKELVNCGSLVEVLSMVRPPSTDRFAATVASAITGSNAGSRVSVEVEPVEEFYKSIPEISNLDSLDLFEQSYIDDMEIQNEDDLSLTIHSTDADLTVPLPAKTKQKPKRSRPNNHKSKVKVNTKEKPEKPSKPRISKCKKCCKQFDSRQLFDKHKDGSCDGKTTKVKKNTKPVSPEITIPDNGDRNCDDADESVKSGKERRKLICQFCTKSFKKTFQLQNHLRVHSGDRPFICHTCGKAFNQEATLRIHLRIHTGVKPHVCAECGEAFVTGNSLLSHRQWKHADGQRPFLCSFCSKSFPTKGAVKKHETIHKVERKHTCTMCERNFARADHLKSHMRSHQKQDSAGGAEVVNVS